MLWTRRRFLQLAAQGLGGAALSCHRHLMAAGWSSSIPAPSDLAQFPIVDTHQHLWDLSRLHLPWLAGEPLLNRDYLPSDYLQAVQGLPVVKAVYMEVAVADDHLVKEGEWILEIIRNGQGPTVAAVIGGRPAAEDFPQYFQRFRDNPAIKGIRWIPPATKLGHKLYFSQVMRDNLRLLGQWQKCFDLCIPPDWLSDAVDLVKSCPETRFVLDHCGNADPQQFGRWGKERGEEAAQYVATWQRGIDALAACQNVVCKISGIVARVRPEAWGPEDLAPIVNHCWEAFGPDRVIFASDWPVCLKGASLRDWVFALHHIVAHRPAEERRKLFHDNAVRFYGLT